MNKSRELGIAFGLLMVLVFVFWSPALAPGRCLFLRDLSVEVLPHRSFWVSSGGFALWNPLEFLGTPYSANPQHGCFYPLNLVFFFAPVWRSLIIYIVLHYLLFVFSGYLLFRELNFSRESSFFSVIAFCFGGVYSSMSNLIVLLSVASWVSLSAWLLLRYLKSGRFFYTLLLGAVFAIQFFAGDPQILGECFLIDLILGLTCLLQTSANKKAYLKLFLCPGLSFLLGLGLAGVQILLTLEMFPHSNRAGGYSFEEFALWSLMPRNLFTLFFPNYFLPPDSRLWILGFFRPPSFLLSLYPGILTLFFAGASARENKKIAVLWALTFLAGIFLALGKYNPLVEIIFRAVPFISFFRIPEKFYLLSGFSIAVLAGMGLESFLKKPLKLKSLYPALLAFVISIIFLLGFYFLRQRGFSAQAGRVAHLSLIEASMFRSLSVLLAGLGWILLSGRIQRRLIFGAGIIALAYFDLGYSHFRLNPTTESRFYTGISRAAYSLAQYKLSLGRDDKIPLRVAVVNPGEKQAFAESVTGFEYYLTLREWLNPFWGVYYGVNDILTKGSYYLSERDILVKLLKESPNRDLVLSRCGVQAIVSPDGLKPVDEPLSRAMVFYQAEVIYNPETLVRVWLSEDFPARERILLETEPEDRLSSVVFPAEAAEIESYDNERVRIRAKARSDAWLLFLDSFDSGWRAYVDGKKSKVYRANRFFRAVAIPSGEHTVEFRYLPKSFIYGIIVSGFSFIAWMLALIFSIKKWNR